MGRIVIACYRPKPGKEKSLRDLMKDHLKILQSQDLITDRASIVAEAKDGTVIEVFEWKSRTAIESAHTNPVVGKMWGRYAEVCEFIPVGQVEEASSLFSEFAPLDL